MIKYLYLLFKKLFNKKLETPIISQNTSTLPFLLDAKRNKTLIK